MLFLSIASHLSKNWTHCSVQDVYVPFLDTTMKAVVTCVQVWNRKANVQLCFQRRQEGSVSDPTTGVKHHSGLIAPRCEPDDWMVTVTLEGRSSARPLSHIVLAPLVKHRIPKPEIPGCNPEGVDLALLLLSGLLAVLLLKAPSSSPITCLFEYYLQKHIHCAGCFNPPNPAQIF